ncbi:hypothetical protein, partial [Mycoplasma todarodis]
VKVTAKPDGTLKVEVTTNTPHASQANKSTSGTANGKSDATLAKPDNTKAIEDLFKNAKLIHQGNRTTAEVANSMNKGSLADKIKAIESETGIKVPTTVNGTKITGIKITEKTDGVIGVEITTETLGAKIFIKTIATEITGDKEIAIDVNKADKLQKRNLDAIKKAIDGHTITNQGKQKVSDIAKEINKKDSIAKKIEELKKHGIIIPKTKGTDITKIKVTGKANGEVIISVSTNTPNAKNPTNGSPVKGVSKGVSNIVISQNDAISKLKELLKDAKLINQKNRTTAEIAKTMNEGNLDNKIKLIKKEVGIDIPKYIGKTKITGIDISEKADGIINVVIATNTPGADQPKIEVKGVVKGKRKLLKNIGKKLKPSTRNKKHKKQIKGKNNVVNSTQKKKSTKPILIALASMAGGIVAALGALLFGKGKK